ncbi:transmembrane protein 253 isoform 2-T3 [Acanthopagrus schlegelii]
MTQNMFQEGLYHVFFKETPSTRPPTQVTSHGELVNVRIHRWFGTVVNTRLLVSGVVQILSALACTLTTVIHACVSYNCSISMTTPVWSSLFYVAAGCLALEAQRKANKMKVYISCPIKHNPTACWFICCKGERHSIFREVFSGVALCSPGVLERPASLQFSPQSGLQQRLTGSR